LGAIPSALQAGLRVATEQIFIDFFKHKSEGRQQKIETDREVANLLLKKFTTSGENSKA
jgi:hypothetical protein